MVGIARAIPGLIAAGVLLAGAPECAAHGSAKGSQHLVVKSYAWKVTIAGKEEAVAAGGKVSDAVEYIAPDIVVTASRQGKYSYGYRLVGPKEAGHTGTTILTFSGPETVIDPLIPAIQFSRIGKHTATSPVGVFVPGIYRLELFLYDTPNHEVALGRTSKEKPTLVDEIDLVSP